VARASRLETAVETGVVTIPVADPGDHRRVGPAVVSRIYRRSLLEQQCTTPKRRVNRRAAASLPGGGRKQAPPRQKRGKPR
jgi:hypothetical protein